MVNDNFGLRKLNPADPILELDELPRPANGFAPGYPPAYPQPYGGYGGDDEDKIDLREYWRRVRKHKWLVLSIVTIVTTLVAVQMYRTKPWYTATTVIEIGKENPMVLKSGDVTLNDDSDPQYLVNINTKKLALDNPELYEKVARDQKLDENPKVVETLRKKTVLSYLNFAGDDAGSGGGDPVPEGDEAREESRRIAPFASYVRKSVLVEQVKNTRALRISYTDEDPVLASEVTNSIARLFMERNFSNQTERFTNSAEWLDSSTRELKAKVQIAEEALAAYTRDNQIYATDSGSESSSPTLTTAKLTQLHDQFIRTQTDRMLKKSLYDQVVAGRITELPEAFSDSKITDFQKKLAELQTLAAELKVKFGPSNPKMIEVRNQIEVLNEKIDANRRSLEAKLRADYERAVKDEQMLTGALNAAKASAVNENQASIKYNILKQDVETARGLYTDFLQKTNQAKAQVAEQNNNVKVIQPAQIPNSPVGPRRMMTIIAGFVLSLIAGIGLAFFLEYLNDTIKSLEDVERYVQLPLLGVIPILTAGTPKFLRGNKLPRQIEAAEDGSQLGLEIKQNQAQMTLLANLDGHSLAGEAYRGLRTSLLLSAAGTPPKLILVTSGQASEGKTTTAVNTAISLAQLGSRVLIIDCDLRRPSVHKRFEISSANGVTNFLSSDTGINSLIQELSIPNLSVMPAGPIPPNPAELLSSKRMKELLDILSKSYDHVIVDSPPIVNVSDPIILSTMVDGTILVVHGGKTTRGVAQRARHELTNVRAKVFGVVLNNFDIRKEGYDYYYYYRYAGYGPNGADASVN